ncbi:Hypothetical_protein [Hexamita inflata]|uniref:Hypothetical_protein n=1 Tax=Hexamita inflata TaxID=28002 RepID=A0AA86U240_9EUKA|nr:Hypothetical protein HINF_LOCUS24766 [Hexamita inflata]
MNFGGGSLTCCLDEQCGYALHERANAHARRYCGRCVYRAAESFRVAPPSIYIQAKNPLHGSTLLSGAGSLSDVWPVNEAAVVSLLSGRRLRVFQPQRQHGPLSRLCFCQSLQNLRQIQRD